MDTADKRRLEERISAKLEVRVWGLDTNSRPFNGTASTLDITARGARITGFSADLRKGDVIGIQFRDAKARCRVAWVGTSDSPRAGQMGIQLVDPGRQLWEIEEFAAQGRVGSGLPIPAVGSAIGSQEGTQLAQQPITQRIAAATREFQVCRILAESQRIDRRLTEALRIAADNVQQLTFIMQQLLQGGNANQKIGIERLQMECIRALSEYANATAAVIATAGSKPEDHALQELHTALENLAPLIK